jgi:hypothetical protein
VYINGSGTGAAGTNGANGLVHITVVLLN